MERLVYEFNRKKISEISHIDITANYLSCFLLDKINEKMLNTLI